MSNVSRRLRIAGAITSEEADGPVTDVEHLTRGVERLVRRMTDLEEQLNEIAHRIAQLEDGDE